VPGFVEEAVEDYALAHSTAQTAAMAECQRDALASLPSPQMLSGPVEGRLLELLVASIRAQNVLEIGTYAGYSALCMAAGLPPGGKILTCEISPERAEFARGHISKSPYAERIEVLVGPAIETIAKLDGPFDLVFIDADKTCYRDYYEAVLGKRDSSADTRALVELNEMLAADERVSCVMLTVRDGITLIRRR
jgi:caffeoyl-CoA O-methyltransferase